MFAGAERESQRHTSPESLSCDLSKYTDAMVNYILVQTFACQFCFV